MNVYVETNFVLELALLQEEAGSCIAFLELCEAGRVQLVIPAYSLAEPYEAMTRRHRDRSRLAEQLEHELRQLQRSANYEKFVANFLEMTAFLVNSVEEESERLEQTRDRIARCARVLPLTADILSEVEDQQQRHDLTPQDALVYAAILAGFRASPDAQSVLLTRNSQDFDSRTIRHELEKHQCKLFTNFEHGLSYVHSRLETS